MYEGNGYAWAAWSQAYGIPVEPYVFVVGADGRIVASFELIVGLGRDPGGDPDRDGRVGRRAGVRTAARDGTVRRPCICHSRALDSRPTGP